MFYEPSPFLFFYTNFVRAVFVKFRRKRKFFVNTFSPTLVFNDGKRVKSQFLDFDERRTFICFVHFQIHSSKAPFIIFFL